MAIQKERCFPRGSKKSAIKAKPKGRNKKVHLFDTAKKKAKPKRDAKKPEDVEEKEHLMAESLSYRSLADGMTVLACVIGVTDYYIRVTLPGRLIGKVTIANVSGPYSKIIRSLLDKKEVSETFYDLKQMFFPGQFVVAKVLKIEKCEGKNYHKVELTLDPATINFNYSHSLIKNGMILQGAVKSVEDHGYMVDFGIKSLTAFLKLDKAKAFISQFNGGRPLGVGQLLLCRIQKVGSSSPAATVVQVTSDPREVSSSVAEIDQDININTLYPGTLVKSLVVENISDGMMVEFLNFKGFVHRDHAGDPPPKVAAICNARVLYTVPLLNTVYLSLLLGNKDLFAASGTEDKSAPKIGKVVKNAIIKSVSRRGIVIILGKDNKYKGFIMRKKLKDGEEVRPEEMKRLYSTGMNLDVRIIGHDKMESIFICSAQKSILDLEYYSVNELEPGMKVKGTVAEHFENGLTVRVSSSNGIEGYAPLTQLADFPIQHPEKRFPLGKKVEARVLKVIKDKCQMLLTLKPSLLDSELPILDKYENAENVDIADGTIFKIVNGGLVVVFYNGVRGFASIDNIAHSSSEPSSLEEAFFQGQTVRCRLIGFNSRHHRWNLSLQLKTEGDPEVLSRLGTHFKLKVTEVNDEGLSVKIVKACSKEKITLKQRKGIIPAPHLSDCLSLTKPLLKTYKAGDTIPSAVLFSVHRASDEQCSLIFSLRQSAIDCHLSFKERKPEESEPNESDKGHTSGAEAVSNSVEEGTVIPCSISKATAKGLLLEAPIPHERIMFVPLHLVSDENLESIDEQTFTEHRLIFGKILNLAHQKKKMILSTKLSEIWNGYDLEPSLSIVRNYLSAVSHIREHMRSDGKSSLSRIVEGQRVEGVVKSIGSSGRALVEVHGIVGVKGKVKPPITAIVSPHHYRKMPINVQDRVVGTVIFVDYSLGQLHLTLNTKTIEEMTRAAGELIAVGSCIRAEILLITEDVAIGLVKGNRFHGELIYLPVQSHCNNFCGSEKLDIPLRPGDIHKVIVSGKESGKMIGLIKRKVTLLAKYNQGKVKRRPRKRRAVFSDANDGDSSMEDPACTPAEKRKKKVEREGYRISKSGVECPASDVAMGARGMGSERKVVDITEPVEVESAKAGAVKGHQVVVDDKEAKRLNEDGLSAWEKLPHLQVDGGFVWDMDILSLPSAVAAQQDVSDESSVEEDDQDEAGTKGKKGKKKRPDSKSAQREQEEALIREAEERLMDPDTSPQTADDFDRLVLSSPDSSIIWLKYIAFHLQNTEIEKARAVAQRALKTINFREEQEKFNIWVCLLNLENLYGTKESLSQVLQDALKMNDAMKVYFQMLQIYLDSKKIEEMDSVMEVMLKKYKDRKEAWMHAGTMCMKANLAEKAGELLRRSFKSLPKRDHVEVICRWAQLEARCECGSVDRAQSLLEGVLAACPKRTDVWSSLADTLVRAGRIDEARNVLERAISQNLPVRKMKVLFKKYLSFEEAHGTPEGAARVRQLALEYVEKGLTDPS